MPLKQRHPSTCSLILGRPSRPISPVLVPFRLPKPVKLIGVTSSADAFISNCSSVVYWLSRNGGFCLGAPHKRGFALILTVASSSPLSLFLIHPRSRTRHSPAHARPSPKSTPHVLRLEAGKVAFQSFLLSLAVHCVSLCFSLALPISPYPFFFIFSYFPFVASFEKVC